MEEIQIAGLLLLLTTVCVSYKGLSNFLFFDTYSFQLGKIRYQKEYWRLITSAFLHGSWMHLLLNMISLYCFSSMLESALGPLTFLGLYGASVLGGSLLSLYINRNDAGYEAIGASGGVCGIIFASIALFPALEVGFPGIPYYIPGWVFGICYVLFTLRGIKLRTDNIGHDAHLGGGLTWLLLAIVIYPEILQYNYLPILLMLLPVLLFVFMSIKNPGYLLTSSFTEQPERYLTKDDRYNAAKRRKEREIDFLLDKINTGGMESLSKKEKQKLEDYSRKLEDYSRKLEEVSTQK